VAFEVSDFPAIQGVDVDCGIFGASGDIVAADEVDAEYGVGVVSLHPLDAVEFDILAVPRDAGLLIRTHV